jgi:hypothetical protein
VFLILRSKIKITSRFRDLMELKIRKLEKMTLFRLRSFSKFVRTYPAICFMVPTVMFQVLVVYLSSFHTLITHPSIILILVAANASLAFSYHNIKTKPKNYVLFGIIGLIFIGIASHILSKVHIQSVISSITVNSN